jgi:hypothetical protein
VIHKRTVFSKTGKGLLEIRGKSNSLPKDQMRLLNLVDGKLNLGELAAHTRIPEGEAQKMLTLLCDVGYIKELMASTDEPELRRAGSANAAALDGDDDLDFTKVLSEPVPAKAAIPNAHSVPQREQAYSQAQEEQRRARDELRVQQERERRQNEAQQRQHEAQQRQIQAQRAASAPALRDDVLQPPDGKPAGDLDAERQALKGAQEEPGRPLAPEQPAAPVRAAEPPRPVPLKADLYADPADMLPESDRSPKDTAAALALAREQAAQRAREEAIRLQQDAKERRTRPQRKPK